MIAGKHVWSSFLSFSKTHGPRRDTRLAKLDDPNGPYSAIIIAKAGLERMGWGSRVTNDLGPPTMYHAVSQGALGIEVRSDDLEALELCKRITHQRTEWMCSAERSCLRVLEGGCSVPVGVSSRLADGLLVITGCVTALDGSQHVEYTVEGNVGSKEEAEALGVKLAHTLLDNGAQGILDAILKDRERKIIKS